MEKELKLSSLQQKGFCRCGDRKVSVHRMRNLLESSIHLPLHPFSATSLLRLPPLKAELPGPPSPWPPLDLPRDTEAFLDHKVIPPGCPGPLASRTRPNHISWLLSM